MNITPEQVQECVQNAKEMGLQMTEQEAVQFLHKVHNLPRIPNPSKGED